MNRWSEREYSKLQERFKNIRCFDRSVGLEDGCFTVMTAYLMGLYDGCYLRTSDEVDKLTVGLVEE